MFPLLCISLQILMIIVLLDAFDKYKKNQASIYFFKCILGIVLLPILIIIPMFLNTLDISSDFIHTDIGQSIVIIIMGMSLFRYFIYFRQGYEHIKTDIPIIIITIDCPMSV